MAGKKNTSRRINLFNLATAAAVFGTGLLLFFQFHVGHGIEHQTFAGGSKILWVNLHRVAALAFVCGYACHIALHWTYITGIAGRWGSGLSQKMRKTIREQIALASVSILALTAGFYAWTALSGGMFHGTEQRHHWIDVHNIAGLALLIGLAIHIKRRWRRMFRPLKRAAAATEPTGNAIPRRGASQLILHNPFGRHTITRHVHVDRRKCTACGKCAASCKHGVLEIIDIRGHTHIHVRHADKCHGCMKCADVCPNGAFKPLFNQAVI